MENENQEQNENQSQDQTQDSNQQPQESTQQIPPTPPQQDGVTNNSQEEYINLMKNTLAAQNRRMQEMETRLAQSTAQTQAPTKPQRTAEELRAAFYEDPVGTQRELIKEQLEATVAPLLDYVKRLEGGTATDRLVNQFKTDPRFSQKWNADIESYVREEAAKIDPKFLNENSMGMLVVGAIGLKELGMLGSAPAPVPTQNNQPSNNQPAPQNNNPPVNNMPTPAYMRPSSPPANGQPRSNEKKLRPLTEMEERLRKESGMTHADFLALQEMPAAEVATTDVAKRTR